MKQLIIMSKFGNAFKLTKPGIAVLLDLVAVTTFFLALKNISLLWKVVPLIVAGTLASFSSSLANNFIDRDVDSRMKRTRWRITSGASTGYLISIPALLAVSLTVSMIYLNLATTIWIALGFLSYSVLYTVVLKRRTSWNIVIGGIAGSFPALAGWSAIGSFISPASLFVASVVFLWTPPHFWSLAVKYKDDYKAAGVPMLPAVSSEKRTTNAIVLSTVLLIAFSFIPLFLNIGLPVIYRYLLIPLSAYLTARIVILKFGKNGKIETRAIKAFLSTNYYLTAILAVLVVGSILRII
jgi:protoheme IX farnesyltransferase